MSESVTRNFDAGADRYDLLTRLNPGYHDHLDRAAQALAEAVPAARTIVDLGCGSGSSTAALLRAFGGGVRLIGVDASAGMLRRARAKQWPATVAFVQGRAGSLGEVLDEPVDGVLACYLFRNVPVHERDAALRDTLGHLSPGGALVAQDYSLNGDPAPRAVWTAVAHGIVLPLATLTGGNPALYRHLHRSVVDFDQPAQFAQRIASAGFTGVESATVPGWQHGILHLFRARRPGSPEVGVSDLVR